MADFGPVVDQVRISNQRSGRTGSIIRFVWHHQASTNDDATIDAMVSGSREVSATYTVSPSGRVTGVVPEQYRPWTSASAMVDGRALTCEVANSSGDPTWGISDASHEACARLAAYAFTQYGVPLRRITSGADGSGHIGHGELPGVFGQGYATFCPGHLDIDRILTRAAQLVGAARPAAGGATPIDSGADIGGGLQGDDDMNDDQDARLRRVEKAAGDSWDKLVQIQDSVDNEVRRGLDFAQRQIATVAGMVSGLAAAVAALQGGGSVDMAALEAAAEKGAKDALANLTLVNKER